MVFEMRIEHYLNNRDGKKVNISNLKKNLILSIDHQGIGGKEIVIEGVVPFSDIIDGALCGNWACRNFVERRGGIDKLRDSCLVFFYGKVNGLGYIVASDEFEDWNGIPDI